MNRRNNPIRYDDLKHKKQREYMRKYALSRRRSKGIGPPKRKITPEMIPRMKELLKKHTQKEVAHIFGVSSGTVAYWTSEYAHGMMQRRRWTKPYWKLPNELVSG